MSKLSRQVAIALFGLASTALLPANQKEGPSSPININTATRTELIQIPRIGEGMAERIVEFRKINGAFTRVEELMNVRCMGEKTFLSIKKHLTVGNKHSQALSSNKAEGTIEK